MFCFQFQKYEQWKEGLPDMKWLDEVLPDSEQWGKFSKGLMAMGSQVKDSIQLDPRLKELTDQRMAAWRNWFDSRLDNAIKAAESAENPELDSTCFRSFSSFHRSAILRPLLLPFDLPL